MYNILYLLNYCAVVIECHQQSTFNGTFYFFGDNRDYLSIFLFSFFFPLDIRCQLFYFYGPLSDRLPLIVPLQQEPAGRKFLINSPSTRPQDWSIPGQTRQGYCSSLRSRPSRCVLDKKSLTHTTAAVCPSTRSINVWRRSPTRKAFPGGRRLREWNMIDSPPHRGSLAPAKARIGGPRPSSHPIFPPPASRRNRFYYTVQCEEVT